MEPLDRSKLTATKQLNNDGNPHASKLTANTLYSARLMLPAAGNAVLLLQQQNVQPLTFNALPKLPANVPLQVSFNPASDNSVNVKVMQWQGTPQVIALSTAQLQLLQQPQNIQQLAQQIAQGEAIRQLAGDAFKINTSNQPVQLTVLPLTNQPASPQLPATELRLKLTNSELFQSLSPSLQQLLLKPEYQALLLQQLQTKAPYLQVAEAVLPIDSKQRLLLQTLLTPLVQQHAQSQLATTSAVLLLQALKALPDIQLTRDMLVKSLNLLSSGAKSLAPLTPTLSQMQQLPAEKTAGTMTSLLKDALTSLKEDVMKAVNLDKVLASTNLAAEHPNIKLQAGTPYFAKLQQSQQHVQFLLQTAQGPLKLALNAMPSLPTDVPLLLSFQMLQSGIVELDVKILTSLPQTITLTKAQAELLQDPKQLALLQQRLMRGETITQLAGESLKLAAVEAKAMLLTLLPLAETSNRTISNTDSSWQLSIQPVNSEQKLRLNSSDFLKPLPLTNLATDSKVSMPLQAESSQLAWRQLLPLLENMPASLRSLPEMPAAVQQLLGLVRQAQPSGDKVLSATQVVEQLQASILFQPLQAQPNLGTAAGTLAVAIQLLLGHLLRQPLNAGKETATQRLAQHIGQLDQQQSSQLLRALGSHSSALQLAQLQNADTASIGQQWLIPLALQQQQESRLSQILIEQRETEKKDTAEQQKYWQLTMKFDLGSYGQLMAVAKLKDSDLQLQFYTDEPLALRQAEKFLPLLTERCTAQGLNVSTAQCQLGKIPDTLGNRRTSLISTKA